MLLPATPEVVAVTVTPPPLETALTPTVAPFRLMASARFVASAVVEDEIEKFAPVSKPFAPPPSVTPDQVKPLGIFSESATVLPPVPAVLAVRVTPVPLGLAVTPEVLGQALIAIARFEASVLKVELVAKVAVGRVVHVFVPSTAAVGPLHV